MLMILLAIFLNKECSIEHINLLRISQWPLETVSRQCDNQTNWLKQYF